MGRLRKRWGAGMTGRVPGMRLEIRVGDGDKEVIRARASALGFFRHGQPDMTGYLLALVQRDVSAEPQAGRQPGTFEQPPETVSLFELVSGPPAVRLAAEDIDAIQTLTGQVRAVGVLLNQLCLQVHLFTRRVRSQPPPATEVEAAARAARALLGDLKSILAGQRVRSDPRGRRRGRGG